VSNATLKFELTDDAGILPEKKQPVL